MDPTFAHCLSWNILEPTNGNLKCLDYTKII